MARNDETVTEVATTREVISCPACKRRLVGPIVGVQRVRCPKCAHTWELPSKHEQTPLRANDTHADQPLNHVQETLDEPLFRRPVAVKRPSRRKDSTKAYAKSKRLRAFIKILGKKAVRERIRSDPVFAEGIRTGRWNGMTMQEIWDDAG